MKKKKNNKNNKKKTPQVHIHCWTGSEAISTRIEKIKLFSAFLIQEDHQMLFNFVNITWRK
jgi:hypothetical protein